MHKDTNRKKCHRCGKSYGNAQKLENHLSRSTCHICNSHFRIKDNLLKHLANAHSEVKLHICDICDKKFRLKGTLQRHISTRHLGIKSYCCHICDKTFRDGYILKVHFFKVHKKSFSSNNSGHKDIVKSYKCHICSQKFQDKYKLRVHLLKKHKNKKVMTNLDNVSSNSSTKINIHKNNQKKLIPNLDPTTHQNKKKRTNSDSSNKTKINLGHQKTLKKKLIPNLDPTTTHQNKKMRTNSDLSNNIKINIGHQNNQENLISNLALTNNTNIKTDEEQLISNLQTISIKQEPQLSENINADHATSDEDDGNSYLTKNLKQFWILYENAVGRKASTYEVKFRFGELMAINYSNEHEMKFKCNVCLNQYQKAIEIMEHNFKEHLQESVQYARKIFDF